MQKRTCCNDRVHLYKKRKIAKFNKSNLDQNTVIVIFIQYVTDTKYSYSDPRILNNDEYSKKVKVSKQADIMP